MVHEDALDAVCQAAGRSIDQLIWQAPHDVARAVTLFGAGVVVLPLLGRVSGIDGKESLEYSSHPQRASGGLMDRLDLELKFGPLDPQRLISELTGTKEALEKRLQSLGNDELQEEVLALQDWREKAMGRLKTLEKRAAWAFLGVAGEGVASQAEIKKAFKRRALELHPDKGGDADRFRLLQEMRDLLVEPKSHDLEGPKDAKKAEEKGEKKETEGEDDAEEEEDFSDDSWDADEEFRKMFPKRKKKPKRQDDQEAEELKNQDFHRGKFEAARRKLHRQLRDAWSRASRLTEEIHRSHTSAASADALRQLRKFVDRFAVTELQRLKENDPKKALRLLRRFLEQGSEVLCAAGALDPTATVSVVAMQVNCPLLQAVPENEELQRRCAALLEAIKELPVMGEQVSSIHTDEGLFFELLIPVPASPDALPGVRRVPLQLPADATLGALRKAALRCGGEQFGGACPRIFSNGRFLAGSDRIPLTNLELGDGPLQCLPSNLTLKNKRSVPKSDERAPPRAPTTPVPPEIVELPEAPQAPRKEAPKTAEVKEMVEENKENDDQWFNDFFAEPEEKQREERKAAQEQGRNAMQARLKAQKQALEAKKKLEQERKKAAEKKDVASKQPQEKRPAAPETFQPPPRPTSVTPTKPDALVLAKEEPCTKLQKSRDAWDAAWNHPCAGAKRSDGTAIFCSPCDGWITVSRFDYQDFEIHCEKVGHFGWID